MNNNCDMHKCGKYLYCQIDNIIITVHSYG